MKRFEWIKTIQLVLYILLTVIALVTIFRDDALYQTIASDPHVRLLSGILWLLMGLSFVFMFLDFGSYTDLKRENLALDQAIYSDTLTGVANRYSCDAYISQYLHRRMPKEMGCITLDLINLTQINQQYGHEGGDEAIREFSEILTEAARIKGAPEGATNCFIGRNGGNKFLAIFRSCSHEIISDFLLEVEQLEGRRETDGKVPLVYAVGVAFDEESSVKSLVELVALSDHRASQDEVHKRTEE
ncbi:MAG: diguanylate cyclase [Lachnospiraceae bacterium]|nr:diguanylate cyclase [Sarcina sp.]MBR2730202.1 diguanylate cyclase [Lachnospiraceae bacterium]